MAFIVGTSGDDRVGVVLIAGGLQTRIVSDVQEGDRVGIGTRIGLIRFGSRVDLYLPKEYGYLVAPGQTMVAGETIIADMKSTEQERSARLI